MTAAVKIGLELHFQLRTLRKLFSDSLGHEWKGYDIALPGTLPILNKTAVVQALRMAVALQCSQIPQRFSFDRKHYHYHDLPAGYQITQKYQPVASQGRLKLHPEFDRGFSTVVSIVQLQLEQDTMRTQQEGPVAVLDPQRANTALLEIVTGPDMSSAEEATIVIRKLAEISRTIGVSAAQMDDSSLRVDVNVSVGDGKPCELKNLVSLKNIHQAIESEIRRQQMMISAGKPAVPSTRCFNADTGETELMRVKEQSRDYKFMPDPELPDVLVPRELISKIRKQMPLLPDEIKSNLFKDMGLSVYQINTLFDTDGLQFFENTVKLAKFCKDPTFIAKFITNTFIGELHAREMNFNLKSNHGDRLPSPKLIASLLDAISTEKLLYHQAKSILQLWIDKGIPTTLAAGDPLSLTLHQNPHLQGSTDDGKMDGIVNEFLKKNPKILKDLTGDWGKRPAKPQTLTFIAGQIMRQLKGQADPADLKTALKRVLVEQIGVSVDLFNSWQTSNKKQKK